MCADHEVLMEVDDNISLIVDDPKVVFYTSSKGLTIALSTMTLSIMTLSTMTLSIMTLSIMTRSIMTLSIMTPAQRC